MTWAHPDLAAADRAVWDDDDWDGGVAHCFARIAPVARDTHGPVLDIGCGTGRLLAPMERAFPDVEFVGIDPTPAMLAHAATRCTSPLICGSHRAPPTALGGAYSVVTFQHLPAETQGAYVAAVGRALTAGGRFVLQFVPAGDTGPLCHPVPVRAMAAWFDAAGMDVTIGDDEAFPTWAWASGVKR